MVKLQKHKAYTYKSESGKNIEHYKYIVTIPQSAISKAEWDEGQELNCTVNGNTVILRPIIGKEDDKR